MEKEVSPVEARSGIISGRVLAVLAVSFAGAAVALVIAWLAIGFRRSARLRSRRPELGYSCIVDSRLTDAEGALIDELTIWSV